MVRVNLSLLVNVIFTIVNFIIGIVRDLDFRNKFFGDISLQRFLPDEETTGRYPVVHRDRFHCKMISIDDYFCFGRIYFLNYKRVSQYRLTKLQLQVDNALKSRRTVDIQRQFSGQEVIRADEADQSVIVIAMEMGNKNMADPLGACGELFYLHLGALPAIQ